MYFSDISEINGFVKKQKRVQVKAQLMIGEIPIGGTILVSEQITETVDKQKIEEIINKIAKPLIDLGIKVVISSFR